MKKRVLYIGLDVHKQSVHVAIAPGESTEVRDYGKIGGELEDIKRLIRRLSEAGVELRFCYEAGPLGYGLCRFLRKLNHICEVVVPSLIPKKASNRIKTDKRDAAQLARLFRSGELTYVRVPEPEDEAIRDLVRMRASAVDDQRRARQRLKGFLLRLGFRYPGKTSWTPEHVRYLSKLKMPSVPQQLVFEDHLQTINAATRRLEQLTAQVYGQFDGWKYQTLARSFMCLRGIDVLNAMTLISEVGGDFSRFPRAESLSNFLGLVPSEESSGPRRRLGGITKAGNNAARRTLIEAAQHAYRRPQVSPTLRQRQEGQPPAVIQIAWKAQQRLYSRHEALSARCKKSQTVVTALARELGCFVWAIAQAMRTPAPVPETPRKVVGRVYRLETQRKYQKDKEAFKK
jgi:transposase